MKYHEIGERFEHDGVVLEVVKSATSLRKDTCDLCYLYTKFRHTSSACDLPCEEWNRKDSKEVYYKLVEQCKTKDMEQQKNDSKKTTASTINYDGSYYPWKMLRTS